MRNVQSTLVLLLLTSDEHVIFQNIDHISNFSFWLILIAWDILESNSYSVYKLTFCLSFPRVTVFMLTVTSDKPTEPCGIRGCFNLADLVKTKRLWTRNHRFDLSLWALHLGNNPE